MIMQVNVYTTKTVKKKNVYRVKNQQSIMYPVNTYVKINQLLI